MTTATELSPGLVTRNIAGPLSLRDFKLIAFDMDSTLINIECVDEIADAVGRKAVAAILQTAATSRSVITRKACASVWREKSVTLAQMDQIYQQRLRLNPGAAELVAACKQGRTPGAAGVRRFHPLH